MDNSPSSGHPTGPSLAVQIAMRMLFAARTFLLATLAVPLSVAAEPWQHTVEAYLFGAGLDGTQQIGNVSTEIDASFSEILESLEFGAMGAWRGERGQLAFGIDAMFVALGAGATSAGGTRFDVDVDQFIIGADVAYQPGQSVEWLAGLRYVSLDMDLQVRTPGGSTLRAGRSEDWIDPYVGALVTLPINDAWSLTLRGDVGGFGIGSDFSWNAIVRADWHFGDSAAALFGYRVLDIDYESGSGADLFLYDVTQSGPIAGLAWRF